MELSVQQPGSCRLHLLGSNVRMIFTNSLYDAAMKSMKRQVNCYLTNRACLYFECKIYTRIYICMYVCMCIYIYIYIYIFKYDSPPPPIHYLSNVLLFYNFV